MDWDNARIFLSVARVGQFLAAAKQLRLDHATVSRRIGALESELGARLFDRRTNGCVLTPSGERFLSAAERMEADMLRAQAELSANDVEIAGTVRIGAPDGFGTFFLTPRLGKLMKRYPSLNIQLVPLPRTFSLSKREADLAIVIDRPVEGRLVARKLVDYTLRLYASKTYIEEHGAPQTQDELIQHPHITYVQDLIYSDQLNFMPQLFGPGFRRFECASALAQAQAVKSGAGLGVLHDYASRADADLAVVLPDLVFRRAYWMATHADTRELMRVRCVADFISEEIEEARRLFAS